MSKDNQFAKKQYSTQFAKKQYRLAEPGLLDQAVLLEVDANEIPLAVPVGNLRRGGDMEFLDRAEAEKALHLLSEHPGFPSVRVVEHRLKGRPAAYTLRWGDPPPFDGCDYTEPTCALLLGIHYGYSDEAIADQFQQYTMNPRRHFTREQMMKLIRSTRKPQ